MTHHKPISGLAGLGGRATCLQPPDLEPKPVPLIKVHIFLEGHKILRNLHQLFVLCTASQIIGRDFAKFCGLLRMYEL